MTGAHDSGYTVHASGMHPQAEHQSKKYTLLNMDLSLD
jgi:hypothetical protein